MPQVYLLGLVLTMVSLKTAKQWMLCPFFSSFDQSSKNAGGLELIPHNKRSNPSHRFLEIGQNICIDMALVVHAIPYSLRYLYISWVSKKWVFCAERLAIKPDWDSKVKNRFLLFFIYFHFQNVTSTYLQLWFQNLCKHIKSNPKKYNL